MLVELFFLVLLMNSNSATYTSFPKTQKLIFIDSNIKNYQHLLAGIVSGTKAIVLDPFQRWH